jgi:predicted O-methyltransferase YrrM
MTQEFDPGPEIPDDGSRSPVLSHILALKPSGTAVEFGVGRGDSARMIAAQMPLVGFDSGEGLPEDWRPEYPRGSLAFRTPFIENATMVRGWFEDTLPKFDFAAQGYIGLVHFDADLYSSTAMALRCIGPYLRSGAYCVFDEFWDYPGHEDHEQRAWREHAERTGIAWTVIGHCGETWGIRIL